jgi:hypothetical protein
MATSGTYSFGVTRDQVIAQAMKNIGKLDPYDTMDAVDVQDCAFQLNMIVKQRMGRADQSAGLKVWTRKTGYLFLSGTTSGYQVGPTANGWTNTPIFTTVTAGCALGGTTVTLASVTGIAMGSFIGLQTNGGTIFWTTVSIAPVGNVITLTAPTTDVINNNAVAYSYVAAAQQPLNIETCNLRDSQFNDVPVKILRTIQDYDSYSQRHNPLNSGDPSAIFYQFKLGSSSLGTDVGSSADVTKYLVMAYMEPVQDLNNPTDAPEYPQEYFLALTWLLAEQIAPMFFKVWTPSMKALKDEAVVLAFGKDREVTTMFFQPGEDGLS